jgi:hypothetical protein
MEPQIEGLEERLENDPWWRDARARLDETLWSENLNSSKHLCYFFAHEQDTTDRILQVAWWSLESQILYFFRELDSMGVSRIIGEVAPDYLQEFSFSSATQFREYEESLLRDLDIPEVAWERFWALVDNNKQTWLSEVSASEAPYSVYRHLSARVISTFRAGPSNYEHLSPFKWWKPVVAGLGSVLGIVDGIAVPATGGIAITSFAASIIASVVTTIDFPEKQV